MSDKHYVITIERQYGSGGRITGMRLAEELGIHYYDEEILKMTSETSAIGEQYFRLADEKQGITIISYSYQYEAGASAPVRMDIGLHHRKICSASSLRSSASWQSLKTALSLDAVQLCSSGSVR